MKSTFAAFARGLGLNRVASAKFAVVVVLVGCGGGHVASRAAQPTATSDSLVCQRDFGESSAASQLETYLAGASTFARTALDAETSLIGACTHIAAGVDVVPSTGDAQSVCTPVLEKLRADIAELRSLSHSPLRVASDNPGFYVSMGAYAECVTQCDPSFSPAQLDRHWCHSGSVIGQCDGECTGRCVSQVHGRCEGIAIGVCPSGCAGNGVGECDGTCGNVGVTGDCRGACNGQFFGGCLRGCSDFEGVCEMPVPGRCEGECRDGCDVAYTTLRCSGTVRPRDVPIVCTAGCGAQIEAEATIEPGLAHLTVTRRPDARVAARVAQLGATISGAYYELVVSRKRLERLVETGRTLSAAQQTIEDQRALESASAPAPHCLTDTRESIIRTNALLARDLAVANNFRSVIEEPVAPH